MATRPRAAARPRANAVLNRPEPHFTGLGPGGGLAPTGTAVPVVVAATAFDLAGRQAGTDLQAGLPAASRIAQTQPMACVGTVEGDKEPSPAVSISVLP
jgi:hypothetical protein